MENKLQPSDEKPEKNLGCIVVASAGGVNVYEKPDRLSKVVTTLKVGSTLKVLEYRRGWIKVDPGWVVASKVWVKK